MSETIIIWLDDPDDDLQIVFSMTVDDDGAIYVSITEDDDAMGVSFPAEQSEEIRAKVIGLLTRRGTPFPGQSVLALRGKKRLQL